MRPTVNGSPYIAHLQAWADAEHLKPSALAWLAQQDSEVTRLIDETAQRERWQERPSEPPYIASSAAEAVRILSASLNAVLDLGVPLHGAVVRTELEMLGQHASRCAGGAAALLLVTFVEC